MSNKHIFKKLGNEDVKKNMLAFTLTKESSKLFTK